jgi:DNA-binding NtrC family response regulator
VITFDKYFCSKQLIYCLRIEKQGEQESSMETILIVDDDINILRSARSILQDVGYYVLTAENATAAMVILKACHADLVISDLVLPDIPGSKLIDFIHESYKTTPCVLMSGMADGSLRDHKPMFSEDYFLCKPFDADELTEAVLTCTNSDVGAPS